MAAAAGSDASYGFLSVYEPLRKPRPKYEQHSGSVLVSALRDPHLEILESNWFTRGRTYQEGVLSNRRLVFTHFQAYWEHRCMAIHDSTRLHLKVVHEPSGAYMTEFMRDGIFEMTSYSSGVDDDLKDLNVLEIKNSLLLKYFKCKRCRPETKKQDWHRLAGRQGGKPYNAGTMDWDLW